MPKCTPFAMNDFSRISDEARAAFDKLVQQCVALDLHGVLMVSPTCDKCGLVHDFMIGSNLKDQDAINLVRLVGRESRLGLRKTFPAHKDH